MKSKKLVVLLLAIMVFVASLSACGTPSKPRVSGSKMSDNEVEKLMEELSDAEDKNEEFVYGQWYSIKSTSQSKVKEDGDSYDISSTVSGKIYLSEIEYDMKASMKYKIKMTITADGKKYTLNADLKIIILNSETYVSGKVTGKAPDMKLSQKVYSNSDDVLSYVMMAGNSGLNIMGMFGSSGTQLYASTFMYRYGAEGMNYYRSGKTITTEYSSGNSDSKREAINVIKLAKDGYTVSSAKIYSNINYKDDDDSSSSVSSMEIKTASSGSVKAPRNQAKYNLNVGVDNVRSFTSSFRSSAFFGY